MNYPEQSPNITPLSPEQKGELLKTFRADVEGMARMLTDHFGNGGDDPVAFQVVSKLIEARMWSGNLFSQCNVEDLNAKRDKSDDREGIHQHTVTQEMLNISPELVEHKYSVGDVVESRPGGMYIVPGDADYVKMPPDTN